ncbi:uncharacterized protein A1O5_06357, partial [Cladophialophora psammophila CBS 110553]
GIMIACHDDETSIEDLITLTDVKSFAQFGNDPASGNSIVNFRFDLPIDAPKVLGGIRYLPQSGLITGSACETPSPGYFNNQRTAKAFCEMAYWLEAEFRLKERQVGCLTRPVEVADFYQHLHISIQRPFHFSHKVTTGYFSKCCHETAINYSLILGQLEPCRTVHDEETNGIRYVSLPMTLAMNTPSMADCFLPWDTRQSLKCYISCRWEMKTSFSTTKDTKLDSGKLIFESIKTTPTEHCCVYFRPTTNSGLSHNYAAISQIDLTVPKFIKEPTSRWGLLSRQYSLQISLAF